MSQKSPRSRSEAKSQNGSIGEEIEEDIDDYSIEGDDMLRSEKSAVSLVCLVFVSILLSKQVGKCGQYEGSYKKI